MREYLVSQGIAPRNHIKENKIKIKQLQHQALQAKPCPQQEKKITKTIKTKPNYPHNQPKQNATIPPLPLHLLDPEKSDAVLPTSTNKLDSHINCNLGKAPQCKLKRNEDDKENVDFKTNSNFGKVPQYIINRKRQNEEDKRKEEEMYNQPPPGARYATEEEKQQALATLQQNREVIVNLLRELPLLIDTYSLQRKKQFLEQKLDTIESTIALYSQPKVCIPV
eukprot:Phypoly_transcript_17696.p1 GENE.Phypoly_transcript_17696~~Phypoly_transcript_17696.p1  ORF type:complete len:249 (+),score=44.38 Phypoly_transcript_17696:79-747(+)